MMAFFCQFPLPIAFASLTIILLIALLEFDLIWCNCCSASSCSSFYAVLSCSLYVFRSLDVLAFPNLVLWAEICSSLSCFFSSIRFNFFANSNLRYLKAANFEEVFSLLRHLKVSVLVSFSLSLSLSQTHTQTVFLLLLFS